MKERSGIAWLLAWVCKLRGFRKKIKNAPYVYATYDAIHTYC